MTGRVEHGRIRPCRAVAAAAAVAVVLAVVPLVPAGAQAPSRLSLSQSTNLVDGQEVTVTFRGPAVPDAAVVTVKGKFCPAGGPFAQADWNDASTCLNEDGSADGVWYNTSTLVLTKADVASAWERSINVEVFAGTRAWTAGTGGSITCDEGSPCRFVAEFATRLDGQASPSYEYAAVDLSYAGDQAATGCPQSAPGMLGYSGPARLGSIVARWNRLSCTVPGSPGLPTSGAEVDEVESLTGFASGARDLAYAGLGYTPDSWYPASGEPRPAVATPVGLNAAVLAVAGHRAPDARPYEGLWVTPRELDFLFNTSQETSFAPNPDDRETTAVSAEDRQAISNGFVERFPDQFPHAQAGLWPRPDTSSAERAFGACVANQAKICANGLVVTAQSDAATWAMTAYLSERLGSRWRVWDASSGAPAGTPRATSAAIGTSDPPFGSLSTFTGSLDGTRRKQLQFHTKVRRNPLTVGTNGDKPVWVLTDLVSARQQGLSIVGIQSSPDSAPVFPDAESLGAAAATMTPDEHGVLVPDPAAMAAAPGAYPLTFVEQVITPAEPLRTDDGAGGCTLRPVSQALLHDWLELLTGDGFSEAQGLLEPLTPALAARAAESIGQVGAAAGPACAGGGPGGGGAGGSGGFTDGAFAPGTFGSGSFGGDVDAAAAAGAPGAGGGDRPATGPDGRPISDESVPPYGGGLFSGWAGAAVALVLMALLVFGAARVTSRRPAARGVPGDDDDDRPREALPAGAHAELE